MPLRIVDDSLVNKERGHISFSEIYLFYQCPWKHHETYNLGKRDFGGFYATYGTAIHEAIEQKWKYKNNLAWIKMAKIVNLIARLEADDEGLFPPDSDYGKTPQEWVKSSFRIYEDFFPWMEENFPGCELYDIEFEIDADLENFDRKFKGFIDLILYNPKEDIYHIIDLKTSGFGWNRNQLSDTKKLYQVILYKHFFCKEKNIDPKKVQCHYVLLLRNSPKKPKPAIKIHSMTSGTRKVENAVEWMENTLGLIKRGIKLKNPTRCTFCNCGAKNTPWNKKKK